MSIAIEDFLTATQIRECRKIYKEFQPTPAREICKQVIKPAIKEIKAKLCQECSPMYLSYLVEHILNVSGE